MATTRRRTGPPPKLTGKPWNMVAPELQAFIDRLFKQDAGIPGGFKELDPSTITPDDVADPGQVTDGWAAALHVHPIATASPSNATGAAPSEGSASSFLRSDATIQQGVVTTKGDILIFGAAADRLAVGVNGEALTADSAQAKGLLWSHPHKGARIKTLTDNVATGLFEVALPTLALCGGSFTYLIRVADATDVQSESGIVTFAAHNKGGVYNTDIDKGTTSAPVPSAGTLAVTFTVSTGADKVTILVTADTTLTPTTFDCRIILSECSPQVVTFL